MLILGWFEFVAFYLDFLVVVGGLGFGFSVFAALILIGNFESHGNLDW